MNEKVTLSRSEKILKACINGDGTTYDPPQSRIEKLLLALKDKISEETVDLSNYYTKAETYSKNEVDTKLSTVYKVKGSSTIANLPTNPEVGDVYNIIDSGTITGTEIEVSAGDNIVYTSDGWDKLSATIDLSGYQEKLTFDNTPTAGSLNPVTSGGIKTYVDNKIAEGGGGSTITIDSALSDTSTNPVQNKVIKNALDTKQDTLTFDNTPTADSANPVTSGGIKTALDGKAEQVELERLKYYGDKDIIPSDENYFTVNETGETITGLTEAGKTQTELVIPYKINGVKITEIGEYTFDSCLSLKSIDIPNSVTSIKEGAFIFCSSLTSINIPNSVTSIEKGAFIRCSSLTSINIPNSVTSIGASAFNYCTSLTSITIPNSVKDIGSNTFESCTSLTSINIPNSVTVISMSAFNNCPNLTIYCEQGSYAETYANTNNIPIVYTAINNVASGKVTTITVPTTGWTTSTDTNGTTYYSINITDSILTSTGYPIADVVLSSDIAAARLQSEAYQNINKITVNDGSVDLYCFDSLPTVSFKIRIQLLYI